MSRRRKQGKLRKLTLEERWAKEKRNHRRGRLAKLAARNKQVPGERT